MGLWKTVKNPKGHRVNIGQSHINRMKEKGATFCWFKDNIGIEDENSNFYEDDKTNKRLLQNITVVDEDGESQVGYISHIVNGTCYGTNIVNWFIFQPGTYPIKYIIKPHKEVIVTDL
jgi:hypothetical protein